MVSNFDLPAFDGWPLPAMHGPIIRTLSPGIYSSFAPVKGLVRQRSDGPFQYSRRTALVSARYCRTSISRDVTEQPSARRPSSDLELDETMTDWSS